MSTKPISNQIIHAGQALSEWLDSNVDTELRADLASGDSNKGAALIGHKLNYVGSALTDIGTLFDMMPARPEQFQLGEIVSGVTDATAAIQAAMTWSPVVLLADKTYVVSATCVSNLVSGSVIGVGQERTIVHATHTSGAVFRFQRQYSKLKRLSITASAGRTAAGYAAACFGAHFEADDIADDPLVTRMRNCHIADVTVSGQTMSALYLVGPTIDGTVIERCRILNNTGHAIAVDRGFLSERDNKAINSVGVLNIDNCLAFGNKGHALALGHYTDTISTQTVRCVVNNYDANGSDMDQLLLYHGTRKHVFWVSGSNNEINSCVTTGSGTETGIFIQGAGNFIRNLRQVNTLHSVEIGDNVAALYTDGVVIDGVTVVNPSPTRQPYAVVLGNAPNSKNVRVRINDTYDVIEKIDTLANEGTFVEGYRIDQLLHVTDDVIVNNSTTLVDVAELRTFLPAGRKVKIRAVVFYSGNTSADIRLAIGGPATTDYVCYGPTGNVKLGASDTFDIANTVSNLGATVIAFGCSASAIRTAVIEGVIHNGVDGANIAVRFAQLVATVGDTIVHKGSTFEVKEID